MTAFRQRRAFTFVEILVAVSIIATLAAAALSTYTNAQRKSRDARRQADLEAVRSALELSRADNISTGYPNATGTDGTNAKYSNLCCDAGEPLIGYISAMPQDPRNSATYQYTYSRTSGTTYQLCATDFESYAGATCPTGYSVSGTRCCLAPP
jgi:prepilin-type N-terminal cleavage/methylation domain-containing protein